MENLPSKMRIRNESDPDFSRAEITKAKEFLYRRDIEWFEAAEKQGISREKILGENANERIRNLYQIVRDKFQERGITSPFLDAPLFVPDSTDVDLGKSSSSHITIKDREIDNIPLKQLVLLKTLGHELYHSTAKSTYVLQSEEKDNIRVTPTLKLESRGPIPVKNVADSALEEGAAVIFEEEVFDEFRKSFPEDVTGEYDNLMERGRQRFASDGIVDTMIVISRCSGDKKAVGHLQEYRDAENLVRYISSKIPNFPQLLENARIHKASLALAHAIEEKFGEGTYRKIVECKKREAPDLLEELKSLEATK